MGPVPEMLVGAEQSLLDPRTSLVPVQRRPGSSVDQGLLVA